MININDAESAVLLALGGRLRQERLARNESQDIFARRIGLSRQSYAQMEKGSPAVALGYWLKAGSVLGLLATWEHVLERDEDLFSRFAGREKIQRQRAGRKRKEKS